MLAAHKPEATLMLEGGADICYIQEFLGQAAIDAEGDED